METGQIINKISHRLRRRSQTVQKSLGISEAQGRILNYILVESQKHGVHPKDIEAEFGLRSATVTAALASLERDGLIRKRPDLQDGRQKLLEFTEKASAIREALQAEIEETEQRMLTGISPQEKKMFLEIAGRMFENLEQAKKPGQKTDKGECEDERE